MTETFDTTRSSAPERREPIPANATSTRLGGFGSKVLLAIACIGAALLVLGAHWITSSTMSMAYALVVSGAFLAATVAARRSERFASSWQVLFAFFVFAFVQFLNSGIEWAGVALLHQSPTGGNPLASTIWGTLAIQLLETGAAIIPIVLLSRAFGLDLSSVYASRGKLGKWFVVCVIVFAFMFLVTSVLPLHRLFPVNAALPLSEKLALAPALVVLALSNGFQEEFLFRGLFLRKYESIFGRHGANTLQALVFTIAHFGISYTPFLVVFSLVFIFPLGLVCGYLMRKTNGILVPSVFHAAFDIPIYMAFLTAVA